ncbi:MAG TPA: M67 family metallopeptidase, partial [Rhizomicrobium sp.]|jgi:proteasome lid subunit RPN8/RPN11|nr:M67 family metallopeptidase [Rhizomicrobium sp.]
MIERVIIPADLREAILGQARHAAPREACGLLEGTRDGDVVRINAVHSARNVAKADDAFEIDPAEQFRLMHALRDTPRSIVGCYHSHPNGRAEPSERDRAGISEADFIWLIAAVSEGSEELRGFVAGPDGFSPAALAE